jgi:hypothetical protein
LVRTVEVSKIKEGLAWPSRIGKIARCISSISLPCRYWRTVAAPPPIRTSLSLAAARARSSAASIFLRDEMENGAALHFRRRTRITAKAATIAAYVREAIASEKAVADGAEENFRRSGSRVGWRESKRRCHDIRRQRVPRETLTCTRCLSSSGMLKNTCDRARRLPCQRKSHQLNELLWCRADAHLL